MKTLDFSSFPSLASNSSGVKYFVGKEPGTRSKEIKPKETMYHGILVSQDFNYSSR